MQISEGVLGNQTPQQLLSQRQKAGVLHPARLGSTTQNKVASFISPVRPIDTAPPWGWNPAATFQTAFTLAQENKRAQEKRAVEMELEQILLPVKQKQAALALDKMQFEVERQSLFLDRERTAYKQASRGLNDEVRGGGIAGNGDSSNQAPASGYQSRFGFGSKLTPPAASAPQAAQPTTRKVGSGLMPKNS